MSTIIRKKEIRKILPSIFKFIKRADEIELHMNIDLFEISNINTYWKKQCNSGMSTITFNLYHKKRNQIKEAMKNKGLKEKK